MRAYDSREALLKRCAMAAACASLHAVHIGSCADALAFAATLVTQTRDLQKRAKRSGGVLGDVLTRRVWCSAAARRAWPAQLSAHRRSAPQSPQIAHNGVVFAVTSGIVGGTSVELSDKLSNRRRTTYGLFTSIPRLFDQLLADLFPNLEGQRTKSMFAVILAKIPTPPATRKTKSQGAGVTNQQKSSWMACANRLWHTLSSEDRHALARSPCLDTLLSLDAYKAFVAKFCDTATALPAARDSVESEAGDDADVEGGESTS